MSYRKDMDNAKQSSYVKEVVKQPTQQSNVKAKMDPKSPTKISEVKNNGPTKSR